MAPASRPMILVGALQGLVLWFLWRASEDFFWPATAPMAMGALLWAAVATPAAYYLSENAGLAWLRRGKLLALVALAYSLLGSYAGWMGTPLDEADRARRLLDSENAFAHILAAGVMGFILLPLVCGWRAEEKRFDYPQLFQLAWRNALLGASVAAVTGAFWAVLYAGAMLMKSIGMDFIEELIEQPIFVFPVTGMVVGGAFAVGHARAELLINLRRYWLALNTWLLPLLLAFGVMWVLFLPVTGLAPLFATRHAAFTLLWFAALAVLFLNCAWQDGEDAPLYPRWLQKLLAPAWLTLLFVTGIAGWALWLRIAQYGLTDDRVWAAFVWLLATGYALGYSLSLFPSWWRASWRERQGQRWLPTVGVTNIVLALVALVCLALLTSPVLDPRRLGVNAQIARLEAGAVTPDDFDYRYLRWESGRWGELALRRLAHDQRDERRRVIAELARDELAKKQRWSDDTDEAAPTREAARARLQSVTVDGATPAPLPDSLIDYLRLQKNDYDVGQCLRVRNSCAVWLQDFNRDKTLDALVIVGPRKQTHAEVFLLTPQHEGWRQVEELCCELTPAQWLAHIQKGEVSTVAPLWPDLQVGDKRLQVEE